MSQPNSLSDFVVALLALSGPAAAIIGYLLGYLSSVRIAESLLEKIGFALSAGP